MVESLATPSDTRPRPAPPSPAPDPDLVARLRLLVQLAATCLEAGGEASVSLRSCSDEPAQTLVASSHRCGRLDGVQREGGRGPALEALESGVAAGGRLPDGRWPELSDAAAACRVRSAWALPVRSGAGVAGTFNIYCESGKAHDDGAPSALPLLAALAEVVVDDARTMTQLARGNDTLQLALETRTIIGQAQGMLMARQNITATAAFDVLRRASQRSNRKLRDIAADLVAGAGRQPGPRVVSGRGQ